MATICPYCNIEVSEALIEAEDGCCPECGACISVAGGGMGNPDDADQFDEYDNGEPDTFADLDDEEDDGGDGEYAGDSEFDEAIFDDEDFADGAFDEDMEEFRDEDRDDEDNQ